ncbi:MAG: hypothetical protein K6L76_10555 [Agarilytica sp.]
MKAPIFACLFFIFTLNACDHKSKANPVFGTVVEVPTEGTVPKRELLTQNWDIPTREKFWYTSQGSRFFPYVWFTWLEQADSETLFRDSANMASFGYLPEKSSALNPAGLPIGFALDLDKHNGNAWLGFTCAACHTGQVSISGTPIIIEGGGTHGDFTGFFDALRAALKATKKDTEKFDRFAKRVLAEAYSPALANKLAASIADTNIFLDTHDQLNKAIDSHNNNLAGHGRIDAFGIIQNAASALSMGDFSNHNASDAPVSYPFLWGTNQSDVVQWNGLLPNTSLVGPLARNAGEVVGSFGGLSITPAPWWKRWFLRQKNSYTGTVKFSNLAELETWARDLRSPQWQESPLLPPIDTALAAAGKPLYEDNCRHCHELLTREEQHLPYDAVMVRTSVVGTDPVMAHNAIDHMARTLRLEGTKKGIYLGERFGSSAPAIEFAINGTFGLMLAEPITAYKAAKKSHRAEGEDASLLNTEGRVNDDPEEAMEQAIKNYWQEVADTSCDTPNSQRALTVANLKDDNDSRYCYKARPLTGIWATAPYLHNGSVPSLWDLLQAPKHRPASFWVGSYELDAKKVGINTNKGESLFQVFQPDGVSFQPGNANSGHTFGTHLSDEEKWRLIEFLKSL